MRAVTLFLHVNGYRLTWDDATQQAFLLEIAQGKLDVAQIAEQLAPLPEQTVVACIGPRTAFDARAAGLPVHVIAEERTVESLVAALVEYAESE